MEPIFLEQWLLDKIGKTQESDPNHGKSAGSASFRSGISREDVDGYRLFKLKKVLEYVRNNSSFYRKLFEEHGIQHKDVRTLGDLARIPFTQPADLAAHGNRFVCVSHGKIARVTTFTTSGTTGPEKSIFCTQKDLERMTDFMGAGLRTVADRSDVLQIMLPAGTVNCQTDLLAIGAEKAGITPVKAGLAISFEEQIRLIRQHGSTVLFGPTPIIYRMTQQMKEREDLRSLGVKTLFLTVAYLSDSMRNRLREEWNCDVHDHYGLTEMGLGVAVECHAHNGYHFNEADLILEVVDPRTGAVLEEGEGELVFTTLNREGTPLIRYRTHDVSHWIKAPCPCGASTLQKFGRISRRVESEVTIGKGETIYFSLFDESLYSVPEVVDYMIEVRRAEGKDVLTFRVEVTRDGVEIENRIRQSLLRSPTISSNMDNGTFAEPNIELVGLGTFTPGGRAKKMIVDNR